MMLVRRWGTTMSPSEGLLRRLMTMLFSRLLAVTITSGHPGNLLFHTAPLSKKEKPESRRTGFQASRIQRVEVAAMRPSRTCGSLP